MRRKWLSGVAVMWLTVVGLSCARNQHLVSLQIQPAGGATFGAADTTLFVNFSAYGTFDHPPETKDLTSKVTWVSDTPQVAAVSVAGEVSPAGTSCGTSNLSATYQDGNNLVLSNSAVITVDGPASSGCTPAGPQPILTVSVTGSNGVVGMVTSNPAGIDCSSPGTCNSAFTAGTTVTLTAKETSGGTGVYAWSGCNNSLGNQCTVLVENNVSVSVTLE